MTNCTSYDETMDQFRFVVKEVARLTLPGRMTCVHCTDLKRGQYYQRDFPGDVICVHEEMGFNFFCCITIWKDPWHFARRTRMLTLRHKQIVEDSALCRIAPPDYLIVFKKAGKNPVKITHPNGLSTYAGETIVPPKLVEKFRGFRGDQRTNLLSHWIWRRYASPVWMDVRRKRVLPHRDTKEKPEERHVCPLQLDVVERCLTLWSNPGETILTPFMGIGSEAYMSVLMERRAIGMELKESYFNQAVKNVEAAARMERPDETPEPEEEQSDDEESEGGEFDEPELTVEAM